MEWKLKNKIFAIDFDGTLVENNYPEIGKPKLNIINFCKERQRLGDTIILWTCRTGRYLEEALEFLCNRYTFIPDYINENAPYDKEIYPIEGRKINADYYIDDKAISVYNIDILEEKLNKMLNNNNNNNNNNENDFLNKVDKTIASNKINDKNVNLSDLGIDGSNIVTANIVAGSGLDSWGPYMGTCPHCGSNDIEADYSMVLTSMPPKYNCRCKDCKGTFFSGQTTYENESDNAKPSLPSNPSWVPYPPVNPGYGYGNRQGWICPRCGKVNSPDRQFCDCSNNSYYPNIVYCGTNNSSGNAPTTPYVTTTNTTNTK